MTTSSERWQSLARPRSWLPEVGQLRPRSWLPEVGQVESRARSWLRQQSLRLSRQLVHGQLEKARPLSWLPEVGQVESRARSWLRQQSLRLSRQLVHGQLEKARPLSWLPGGGQVESRARSWLRQQNPSFAAQGGASLGELQAWTSRRIAADHTTMTPARIMIHDSAHCRVPNRGETK